MLAPRRYVGQTSSSWPTAALAEPLTRCVAGGGALGARMPTASLPRPASVPIPRSVGHAGARQLEMNRQMFLREGVSVRGVVLNKVLPEKVDMVRDLIPRACACACWDMLLEKIDMMRDLMPRHKYSGPGNPTRTPAIHARHSCHPPCTPAIHAARHSRPP